MLEEKRYIHDLRYQVRNTQGKNMWVRCYAIVKWSNDGKTPLFFSGRVTHQDNDFVVDPVTNFPREAVLFSRLDQAKANREPVLAIGFSFNNIAEINNTRSRVFGDRLLNTICENLMETMSDKASFFRLDGMCCAAIVDSSYKDMKG